MTTAKKPVQIYLEEKQERILRRLAKENKVSLASLLRKGADHVIEELAPAEKDPLLDLPLIAEAGGPEYGSEKHDEYLTGTYEEKRK
jgi:hypothetical protein